MDELFGLIFYAIFDVILFHIGRSVIKIVTFGHVNPTLNGKSQLLTSLIGLLSVAIAAIAIIYFVRN